MSPMPQIGVFLAPTRETPRHIALAEELGFASAWVYDSPLLYHDAFATMPIAAAYVLIAPLAGRVMGRVG
ncbi:MAG: hypothetical protein RJQ03_08335, partial [Miltoncostaeaceae bacterium]